MADRSITLTWATSPYRIGRDDGIRIRFDTSAAAGMPGKIFAYRRLPTSSETGASAGHFSHICSPADLAEYPEDGPLAGQSPQWFRLDFVDVLVRSRQEADDFIGAVRADALRLKRTLDQMEQLEPGGQETIGSL